MADGTLLETLAWVSAAAALTAEAGLCFLPAGCCSTGSALRRLPQPRLSAEACCPLAGSLGPVGAAATAALPVPPLCPNLSWDADVTAGEEAAAAAAGGLLLPWAFGGVWREVCRVGRGVLRRVPDLALRTSLFDTLSLALPAEKWYVVCGLPAIAVLPAAACGC